MSWAEGNISPRRYFKTFTSKLMGEIILLTDVKSILFLFGINLYS